MAAGPTGAADLATVSAFRLDTGCEYAIYGCYPSGSGSCGNRTNIAPIGVVASGAGLWGQLDMAGEVWEWNLEWSATYVNPCTDCASLSAGSYRLFRGGDFNSSAASEILPTYRNGAGPTDRDYIIGVRCARTP